VVGRRWGRHPRDNRSSVAGWPAALGVKLLVVDADHGHIVVPALRAAGAEVACCVLGSDALVSFGSFGPDAVVIAPQLPDLASVHVVAAMRRYGDQPILLGVGPSDAEAAGPVLVAGATGAVSRPYDAHEIVHRVAGELPDLHARARLTFGPVELDPMAHVVRVGGVELDPMPLKEFALLRLLMQHADQVVTAEEIRATLWGDALAPPTTNALAVHVARLRARLRPPVTVRTVRGLGYRLTLVG